MTAVQGTHSKNSTIHPKYTKKTPAIPKDAEYADKLSRTTLGSAQSTVVDWSKKRLHTPGSSFAIKDGPLKELADRMGDLSVKTFKKKNDEQGLISIGGRVESASVTTHLKNETKRSTEKKTTWIQFDKIRICDKDADFKVNKVNNKGHIFYSGCHLIDHKYCAGDAHKDGDNYFPGNYFYNAPIKETLVQASEAYLEIPVYTPNPPTVKAKGKDGAVYPIPACVLFVQISKEKVDGKNQVNVYCFPNNQFDYEELKETLHLNGDYAKKMIPHFKLNPALIDLLKPAIIYAAQEKQKDKEKERADLIFDLLQMDEMRGDINHLSNQVARGEVKAKDLYANSSKINNPLLDEAAKFAGEYLVRYALGNVLKSEVISLSARLRFINSMVSFIPAAEVVSEAVNEFYHSLQEEFNAILCEMKEKSATLTVDQLLDLSYTYFNLTSGFTFPYAMQGDGLFNDEEFEDFYKEGIAVLRELVDRNPLTFSVKQKEYLLEIIHEADQTLILFDDLQQIDDVKEEGLFLYECRDLCEVLIGTLKKAAKKHPAWWLDSFQGLGIEPDDDEESTLVWYTSA